MLPPSETHDRACTHALARACTHTHTHTHTHKHDQSLTLAHTHIHTYTHNHSRAHEHARAHTQIPSERERDTHTCQPPGRSSDRGVDSKGLRSSGCKTSSTATRVAGSKRTPGSQQRLQDIIYHHSGCREPAVIYRRPMLPGFGIHLDVGDSGVQFGAGQMSAAGLHAALKVQVRAARHRAGLASERVCNVR